MSFRFCGSSVFVTVIVGKASSQMLMVCGRLDTSFAKRRKQRLRQNFSYIVNRIRINRSDISYCQHLYIQDDERKEWINKNSCFKEKGLQNDFSDSTSKSRCNVCIGMYAIKSETLDQNATRIVVGFCYRLNNSTRTFKLLCVLVLTVFFSKFSNMYPVQHINRHSVKSDRAIYINNLKIMKKKARPATETRVVFQNSFVRRIFMSYFSSVLRVAKTAVGDNKFQQMLSRLVAKINSLNGSYMYQCVLELH